MRHSRRSAILTAASAALVLAGCTPGTEQPDAVYFGGDILTIVDDRPSVEAVAVKDGRILAVGSEDEILQMAGSGTTRIDLDGQTMLPGFFDSHGHTYLIGIQATSANLLPPPDGEGADIASLQRLLSEWAAENQEAIERVGWIVGFGYDDSQLAEQRHPTRDELDEVSTEVPVLIFHQSGHLGVGNSKALEMAGVTAETEDPNGGAFRRREGSREPNGVAEEYAFFQLGAALMTSFDDSVNDALVEEGTRLVASFGYTTAQEGRAVGPGLAAMKRVADAGRLQIDLVSYPDVLEVEDVQPSMTYSNRYRVGGVKLTIDGSPQGKTAWLTEPYYVPPEGQPADYRGYAAIDGQTANEAVEKAFANRPISSSLPCGSPRSDTPTWTTDRS
jgi:predicted amidohydrolase YtcJ